MAAKVWSHKTIVERFKSEMIITLITCTDNSLSEALIFETINPKCDNISIEIFQKCCENTLVKKKLEGELYYRISLNKVRGH